MGGLILPPLHVVQAEAMKNLDISEEDVLDNPVAFGRLQAETARLQREATVDPGGGGGTGSGSQAQQRGVSAAKGEGGRKKGGGSKERNPPEAPEEAQVRGGEGWWRG